MFMFRSALDTEVIQLTSSSVSCIAALADGKWLSDQLMIADNAASLRDEDALTENS